MLQNSLNQRAPIARQSAAPVPSARPARRARIAVMASQAVPVDKSVNPLVASVKPSKTMALTDLATSMKEQGIDVGGAFINSLAIG